MTSTYSDRDVLFKLPFAELQVSDLQRELTSREIQFDKKLRKAELSEILRMQLETTQDVSTLIKLRDKEIRAMPTFKKKPLVAKLKGRGLPHSGTKDKLAARLKEALEKEKTEFGVKQQETAEQKVELKSDATEEGVPRASSVENVPNDGVTNDDQKTNANDMEQKPPALTQEQLDRMEQNRKRALARLAETQRKKQQVTAATTPAAAAPTVTPASNPYAKPSGNPYATFHTPKNTPASPLASTKVPPCTRCGDPSGRGLCIVWNHSGEIQRERGFYGDEFRYDCCGRLDPQPCFVGTHTTTTLPPMQTSRPVQCKCWKPAHLKRTRKSGSNCGRFFFRCNSSGRGECDFFQWADEAFGLPKQVPRTSLDGIKEWQYPYANPFGERVISTAKADANRKRLIAGLLLHELCVSISGSNGFVSPMTNFGTLLPKVVEMTKSSETVVKNLYPLTKEQASRRFGSLSLDGVTEGECESILLEMLTKGSFSYSIGVRLEELYRGDADAKFAYCTGLEAYMHV